METAHVATVSTRMYEVKNGKAGVTLYSSQIPISKPNLKPQAKSVSDVIERRILEGVYPEIFGTSLGGILLLFVAVYSFFSGMSAAGIALIGPAIAGILGALVLLVLGRKGVTEN
jgi:multisubunit Na+/H+ antiporter MnhB subunit